MSWEIGQTILNLLKTNTDSIESKVDISIVDIGAVETKVDAVKVDTVNIETKVDDSILDIGDVETKVDTSIINIGTVETKVDAVKSDTVDIESKIDILQTLCELVDSKIDILQTLCELIDGNIGVKTDKVAVPFVSGSSSILGFQNTVYKHIHNPSLVYPSRANSIQLTSSAGAWAVPPTPVEIIPANGITSGFDIHWALINSISANGEYELELYSGGAGEEVLLSVVAFTRTAAQSQEGSSPNQLIQVPANTRISAAMTSSEAGTQTAKLKLYYHTYE